MRENQLDNSNITSTQSLRPALEHEESRATLAPEDGFSPVLAQGGHDAASHARELNRITRGAPSRASHSLLQMQRTHGNRYVQRVLEIARQGEGKGEGEVSPEVEASIERSRGGGQSLEKGTRSQMESAFGVDFSGVRIHTGAESHSLNRAVSAVAFTTGSDIFFRDGAYNPGSSDGRELLAHELTHVVQQGGGPTNSQSPLRNRAARRDRIGGAGGSRLQAKLTVSHPTDSEETEAERIGETVAQSLGSSAGRSEAGSSEPLSVLSQGLHRAEAEQQPAAVEILQRALEFATIHPDSPALSGRNEPEAAGGHCSCGGRCPKCAQANVTEALSLRSGVLQETTSRDRIARDASGARSTWECVKWNLASAGVAGWTITIIGAVCGAVGAIIGLGGGPAAPATAPSGAAVAAAVCLAGVAGLSVGFVLGIIKGCLKDTSFRNITTPEASADPGKEGGPETATA